MSTNNASDIVYNEFDVIIEIPKGSRVKYERDEESGLIYVDRILQSAYVYPFNYGYIPNTLSEDGDPVDVMVLGEYAFFPGCAIKCRIIGGLDTYDGKVTDSKLKRDPKLIAVPVDKVDVSFKGVEEVPDYTKRVISDFFSNYKKNEVIKIVKVGNWMNKTDAMSCICNV